MITKLKIVWKNPSKDKPIIVDVPENFDLNNVKDFVASIEQQYGDKIIAYKPSIN